MPPVLKILYCPPQSCTIWMFLSGCQTTSLVHQMDSFAHVVRISLWMGGMIYQSLNESNLYLLLTNHWIYKKVSGGCGVSYQGTDPLSCLSCHTIFKDLSLLFSLLGMLLTKALCHLCALTLQPNWVLSLFQLCWVKCATLTMHTRRVALSLCTHSICWICSFSTSWIFFYIWRQGSFCWQCAIQTYFNAVFVDWMHVQSLFFDCVIASLPGTVLKGDHTFWFSCCQFWQMQIYHSSWIVFQITKQFAQLGNVLTHVAMYNMVNEYGECWYQALTGTKSLTYVDDCYKGIANGLKAYGHKPTELMYRDNAHTELAFYENNRIPSKKCLPCSDWSL